MAMGDGLSFKGVLCVCGSRGHGTRRTPSWTPVLWNRQTDLKSRNGSDDLHDWGGPLRAGELESRRAPGPRRKKAGEE